ncbi:MAG TPA: diacylglycerol kinase [Firmicutes bacterium]|nr:diacylglycerol kinase [Bacillota bacterium]
MMRARNIIDSFHFAIKGLVYVLKTQRNMRMHFIVALGVLLLSSLLGVHRAELTMLLFAISLVITLEIVNTAIETLVDILSPGYHHLAEITKNVAAAAVLVSALNAVAVGYLILGARIFSFISRLI